MMATPLPRNRASFTIEEIVRATAGQSEAPSSLRVTGIAIDSRAVVEGGVFVAVRGEQQDGAKYLPAAIANGAALLIVTDGTAVPEGVPSVFVADTTRALGDLARFHRVRWGKPLIAITGSAGKTTTKELTAAAFAGLGDQVLKTLGNLNNQFGVPMTLLCLEEVHELAVLELGTSGRGEIARLGEIAQPNVAVVLLAALAHTAGIGTLEDVADEKASLWRALAADGVAIVNADDRALMTRVRSDVRTLSFGLAEGADVRLVSADLTLDGTELALRLDSVTHAASLRLLGDAAALDAAAALASVLALRGTSAIARALEGMSRALPTPGRMALARTDSGILVIDDSYNANPSSTELGLASLVKLSRVSNGRSLAVLGDMLELGDESAHEHARIGELAVRLGVDVLVGCGRQMAFATSRAARLSAGRLAPHPTRVVHVVDCQHAVPIVKSLARAGDVMLVKGSRGMAMERVVAQLGVLPQTQAGEGG
jgi:UDP-N-acetylmuramoyl-tripeptide--D-alanyl-D-alanine ligase